MKRIILPILCLLLICSCSPNKESEESTKKGSSGKTLEMLFVSEKRVYQGATKDLVDSLFRMPQLGLPQAEPMFDLVHIPSSSFANTEMFKAHRNIIICDINPENPNKVYFHKDQWSTPQVVFDFAVKSQEAFDTLLIKYYPTIKQEIYRAEHRRVIKAFKGIAGRDLMNSVYKQFGFRLTLSNEFELANMRNPQPEMAWIRKETKDFGIGVLVNVLPYTNEKIFEEDNMMDQIDSLMKHVEGPADSSYMGIERRVDSHFSQADFEQSKYAMELRGCWRLYGDFMGGPFVAYAALAPDQKHVVLMVGYVYCPRFGKRDYLMQVESICHSIKFE